MTDLHFSDIIDWLKHDFKHDAWTTVYKSQNNHTDSIHVFSILFPHSLKKKFLANGAWSLNETHFRPGFVHYSDRSPKYFRWGIDTKFEPFLYECFYNTLYPTTIKIIEEFILYFNLYHDTKTNTYISVNVSSEENVIIKVIENEIKVKTNYLREFLSAKKLIFGLQFDYYRFSSQEFHKHGLSERDYFKDSGKDYCYDITFQESTYFNDPLKKVNSRLIDKKIVENLSNFQPKLWSDNPDDMEYEKFIIGLDLNSGTNISQICNPDNLGDFYGKNPSSPSYFTPVFFNREVLLKYYHDTNKYSVHDGCIELKGAWRLEIDNDKEDSIIVYLGDLGRSLPFTEQKYWSSFNIPPNGEISDVKFKRDFLTIASSPKSNDLVFKFKFERIKKNWFNKFGYHLFNELSEEDNHCLKSIHIPLYNNQSGFDTLILNLTKVLIDYINEKEILKRIKVEKPNTYGIAKLEILLNKFNPNKTGVIPFLRNLQSLRSKGSAHQKGRDYKKIIRNMNLENKSFIERYDIILGQAIYMFDELDELIKETPSKQDGNSK